MCIATIEVETSAELQEQLQEAISCYEATNGPGAMRELKILLSVVTLARCRAKRYSEAQISLPLPR